jgi:hypothetical protein
LLGKGLTDIKEIEMAEENKPEKFKYDPYEGMNPLQKIGMVLAQGGMAFGEGLTQGRAPFYSNFMQSQNQNAQRAFEQWKTNRQLDPEVIKAKAAAQFEALKSIIGSQGANALGNLPPDTKLTVGGLSMPLNRSYSEGESKSLSGAEDVIGNIQELKNMYKTKKTTFGAELTSSLSRVPLAGGMAFGLAGLGKGGDERQNFADLVNNINNRLLYLRSGAQINDKEYRRLTKMMPSLWRRNEGDVRQLERFEKEFTSLMGRIQSGARWDEERGQFIGGKTTSNEIDLDKLFSGVEGE